jgi:hypothetical protein
MAAAHHAFNILGLLESAILQYRTWMMIACAYAAIIRTVLQDWQAQPQSTAASLQLSAWPLYNGVQLLDPTIREPLDRASVLAKVAASQPAPVRRARQRGVKDGDINMPKQQQLVVQEQQLEEEEKEQQRQHQPSVTRRETTPRPRSPIVGQASEGSTSNIDDWMLLLLMGATAVAYLVIRTVWVRRTSKNDEGSSDIMEQPINRESLYL